MTLSGRSVSGKFSETVAIKIFAVLDKLIEEARLRDTKVVD